MLKNKILFIGESKKFIESFKIALNCNSYDILSWRKIGGRMSLSFDHNILVICGYNHQSYHLTYNEYYKANVEAPYNFIIKNFKKNIFIYYINTSFPVKNQTYSRYCFAKHKLSIDLNKTFENFYSIEIPLLLDEKNNVDFYAGLIEKRIALIIMKIKRYQHIKVSELSNLIKTKIENKKKYNLENLNGKYLYIIRTRFIDKILRIILG